MPSNWLPLPTHSGWWWRREGDNGRPEMISVMPDARSGNVYYTAPVGPMLYEIRATEGDKYSYYPVPDPPPDGEPLPRRFRWKKAPGVVRDGIMYPDGCVDIRYNGGRFNGWLAEHADEIEWIDL